MKIPVGPVTVDLEDHGDRICVHMLSGKGFEPHTLAVWGHLCLAAKGRPVVDAGAYSGLFTIAAAMIGAQPHAFEPMPLNAKRIVNNAHRNGGQELRNQIKLHRMGLSDEAGRIAINFNPAVTGLTSGASIVNRKLGNLPSERQMIEVRALDSFGFTDLAAIKIDVERAEPNVLRGAHETLARCRPTLIVEVLGAAEKAAVKAAAPGYEVAEVLDERNWLMVPS